MEKAHLIKMANQIAEYFAAYPKSEAIDGIAKHVHNTWEPRMRNGIKEVLDQGGDGLKPLCIEALNYYFKGPNSDGRKVKVNPKTKAPGGAAPSFADGGGDAG